VLQIHQRHVVGDAQPIAQIVAHLHAHARLQWRLCLPVQAQRLHAGVQRAGVDQPAGRLPGRATAPQPRFHPAHAAVGIALGQQLQIVARGAGHRRQWEP